MANHSHGALLLMICLLATWSVPTSADFDDETFLARPILYQVFSGGNFSCVDNGARCVYQNADYERVVPRGGQTTINIEGMVWSATNNQTDYLVVTQCKVENCYVNCNANCTCVTPDQEICARQVTRAPTPATETPAPVPRVCPQQSNKQHCRALMPKVPPNNFFDCYNFCGGVFLSTCTFAGQCGALTCTNATGSGINSLVTGCMDEDRIPASGSTSGSTTTMRNSLSIIIALLALMGSISITFMWKRFRRVSVVYWLLSHNTTWNFLRGKLSIEDSL